MGVFYKKIKFWRNKVEITQPLDYSKSRSFVNFDKKRPADFSQNKHVISHCWVYVKIQVSKNYQQ